VGGGKKDACFSSAATRSRSINRGSSFRILHMWDEKSFKKKDYFLSKTE
jgi:hypothetical protein